MSVDIQKLKYFVAVYEEGSITKAAQRCYVSQPYLSSVIQELETILGVKLFERDKRGAKPTENARRFYEHVKELISNYEKTLSLFTSGGHDKELSIGFMPTLRSDLIYRIVEELRKAFKDTVLRIVDFRDKADLRVVSDIYVEKGETFLPLWKEDMVLAVPISLPLALEKEVELKDLENIPFIDRESCEYHEDFESLVRKMDLNLNLVAKVRSEEAAVSLVSSGLGACILPEMSLMDSVGISIKRIKGMNCYRIVGISVRERNRLVEGAIRVVVDTVKTSVPKKYLITGELTDYGRCEIA